MGLAVLNLIKPIFRNSVLFGLLTFWGTDRPLWLKFGTNFNQNLIWERQAPTGDHYITLIGLILNHLHSFWGGACRLNLIKPIFRNSVLFGLVTF